MTGTDIFIGSAVDTSPWGKRQPYEGVWDSTIALWDGGFEAVAGVPANGAARTNLMRNRLASISGLALADCDFTFENTTANGFASIERSAEGGLHLASTQAGAQNAASNLALKMSSGFCAWLLSQTDAGADYAVMVTLWLRPTRAPVGGSVRQAICWLVNSASATGSFHSHGQGGASNTGRRLDTDVAATVAGMPGCQSVDLAVLAPASFAVASKGWHGTKPADLGPDGFALANIGAAGAWDAFNFNQAASAILYRAQLDLVNLAEIDGATVAEKANAILAAQNSLRATAFAAGGRFADDVFTPPATLKP